MRIIGLDVRTSNIDGRGLQDLGALWGAFLQRNDILTHEGRRDQLVYCFYTDYESDYTGEYTAMIGVEVTEEASIPEGVVTRVFEGGSYETFVAKGALPQAVGETWQRIWAQDSALKRSYIYDYEVYGAEEDTVFIYIGVQ